MITEWEEDKVLSGRPFNRKMEEERGGETEKERGDGTREGERKRRGRGTEGCVEKREKRREGERGLR